MGKLITVVGNSGVGKTTLTHKLCEVMPELTAAFEQHIERPFQALFAANLSRYALANQIDYFLYRAEQELRLRQTAAVGIVDGGLDIDFYGFAHLFFEKGYLTAAEFALCQREYVLLRQLLSPPDLIIYLTAPLDIINSRYAQRGRALEITQRGDLARLDQLIAAWLHKVSDIPVITIAASDDSYCDEGNLQQLQTTLHHHGLGGSGKNRNIIDNGRASP